MANNSETEIFKFDLDNAEFVKKVLESKNLVLEVGDSKNLSGLVTALTEATAVVGTLGIAYLAVKTAIDWVEEAEKIKLVNRQFELLASGVGLTASKIKDELITAAGGLVDDVDLLKSANKAIVEMGDSASKLGEIMGVARKATAIMGGDLIENFESLNKALATGNQRMLRQFGVVVDASKAVTDYAKKIGEASGNLSDLGKRHAIMEAALAALQGKYKDINAENDTSIQTWARLKTTLKEIGDVFVIVFDKIMGPAVRQSAKDLAAWFHELKVATQDVFGDGMEQAVAHVENLKLKIGHQRDEVDKLTKSYQNVKGHDPFVESAAKEKLQEAQKALFAYRMELGHAEKDVAKLRAEQEKKAPAAPGAPAGGGESEVDLEAKRAGQAKYYSELAQLRLQYEKSAMDSETNINMVETHMENQRVAAHAETAARIEKINVDTKLNEDQKRGLREQEELNLNQKLISLAQQREQIENKIIDNLSKKHGSATQEFANGWTAATLKAKQQMNDWSARGSFAAETVSGTLVAGFKAVGSGAESMSSAMKKFILGALAQRAIAEGSIMLLSGIWPPNPAALAGGAALVALGGALAAASGGEGGGISASSGGGGGGGGGGGATSYSSTSAPDTSTVQAGAAQNVSGRHVALNIHGNFINTEENARWIMEMMRKETDTTAFDFYKVGGK